ncbi:MAG: hypothetical protein OJF49_001731 [Ktedonobacterales bacterium]|jgi:phosphatidylserine/phosphatidylglycerophosphate/cardiolipin synthase-like enzyme|nr:MAG: hypothetical protein OJF49_001731 [Ktedonobacterales bacterium]
MNAFAPRDGDTLTPYFLAQDEQHATDVAQRLAAFIAAAEHSLDFALYDFRLSDPLFAIVADALGERAHAGVTIRIAFDGDKPEVPQLAAGMDPAPQGTEQYVRALGYPFRRIGGLKLMHNKYVVRDAGQPSAAVWTGSTNFTDDAWEIMENNIVSIVSPALAAYYSHDFTDLWNTGEIGVSGAFDTQPVALRFGGATADTLVHFSPGRGVEIDAEVARIVASAQRRVRVCSMLLNSGHFINALQHVMQAGRAQVSGIYDRTQMQSVVRQWGDVPHNTWKISAVEEIVRDARLVGKNSTPYSPESTHDFMHNKVMVVDDTVITGSYNFSNSAEMNAENILVIASPALAETYSQYTDRLMRKYAGDSVGRLM